MKGQKAEVGDTRWSPNGYHYTKTADRGWILTHRLVKEEQLGRQLEADERVRFADGDRSNYKDPDNIIVYKVKQGSNARRIAQIEAKIEQLQLELESLRREESPSIV